MKRLIWGTHFEKLRLKVKRNPDKWGKNHYRERLSSLGVREAYRAESCDAESAVGREVWGAVEELERSRVKQLNTKKNVDQGLAQRTCSVTVTH